MSRAWWAYIRSVTAIIFCISREFFLGLGSEATKDNRKMDMNMSNSTMGGMDHMGGMQVSMDRTLTT